jgi:hypothetical protein
MSLHTSLMLPVIFIYCRYESNHLKWIPVMTCTEGEAGGDDLKKHRCNCEY